MVSDVLRTYAPALLAIVSVLILDRSTIRRGLQPPGFQAPQDDTTARVLANMRRAGALAALALVAWLGIFGPLGTIGESQEVDPSLLGAPQLFLLHALFALALLVWYVLGFSGLSAADLDRLKSAWKIQFGFATPNCKRELLLGAGVGVAAWFVVLAVLIVVGAIVWQLGGEGALPSEPPTVVVWVAALPLWLRFAVSLSAGLVEETFFRGFLQPRVGIPLSTGAFVLAHLSYEQPFMLVGITLLSLTFAYLVRWRQNIWAAIAAHTVFDSVQLLFVIPRLLDLLQEDRAAIALIAWLAAIAVC